MADYFVGTQAECEALIAKMDILMGYPNPPTKTDTYAKTQKHDTLASTFFVRIKSVWAPALDSRIPVKKEPGDTGVDMESVMAGNELTSRKTLTELEGEGAFPKEL